GGLLVPLGRVHLPAGVGGRLLAGRGLRQPVVAEGDVQEGLRDRAHARGGTPVELVLRDGVDELQDLLLGVAHHGEQVVLECALAGGSGRRRRRRGGGRGRRGRLRGGRRGQTGRDSEGEDARDGFLHRGLLGRIEGAYRP